ncbi:UNVERIFIED_CONTAM: hypothetical protein GTU68_057691 [Idotea baltica]|nr:hypothetical protein [Idotea baltica]
MSVVCSCKVLVIEPKRKVRS